MDHSGGMQSFDGKNANLADFRVEKGAEPFVIERVLVMSETDAAGLVHFSACLKWVEEAEAAWFEALGLEWFRRGPEGVFGYPRRSLMVDFSSPLPFPGSVRIGLAVERVGERSLHFAGRVVCLKTGKLAVSLRWSTVFASIRSSGQVDALSLPPEVRRALAPLAEAHQAAVSP
jgi:acyl-CoA thioester hydrolase